jgi:hypothetical protein
MTIVAGTYTIAGADSGKVEDEQNFALQIQDGDSVENVIGAAYPKIVRRGNRLISCSFTVSYEYATPAAAATAMMSWTTRYTDIVSVTMSESGTVLSLADAAVTPGNISRTGCTVQIQWSISGRLS